MQPGRACVGPFAAQVVSFYGSPDANELYVQATGTFPPLYFKGLDSIMPLDCQYTQVTVEVSIVDMTASVVNQHTSHSHGALQKL